jgi:hypothetical protein
MRRLIVPVLLATLALTACIEEKVEEREKADAYCYMIEQCGMGEYATCYDAATANLESTLYDQCRGARELLLDCLGRLDCGDYLLWSESDPETDLVYPCRDQDQLEAVACQNE